MHNVVTVCLGGAAKQGGEGSFFFSFLGSGILGKVSTWEKARFEKMGGTYGEKARGTCRRRERGSDLSDLNDAAPHDSAECGVQRNRILRRSWSGVRDFLEKGYGEKPFYSQKIKNDPALM